MTNPINAGSILVEGGLHLPKSFLLQDDSDPKEWTAVNGNRSLFEKAVDAAGWSFFFLAGEISTTVFGADSQKTRGVALQRLIANVKSQHCNSIEITQVAAKSFLKMPYVRVTAHARQLQKESIFTG